MYLYLYYLYMLTMLYATNMMFPLTFVRCEAFGSMERVKH